MPIVKLSLSKESYEELQKLAGNQSVQDYIRSKVFGSSIFTVDEAVKESRRVSSMIPISIQTALNYRMSTVMHGPSPEVQRALSARLSSTMCVQIPSLVLDSKTWASMVAELSMFTRRRPIYELPDKKSH